MGRYAASIAVRDSVWPSWPLVSQYAFRSGIFSEVQLQTREEEAAPPPLGRAIFIEEALLRVRGAVEIRGLRRSGPISGGEAECPPRPLRAFVSRAGGAAAMRVLPVL